MSARRVAAARPDEAAASVHAIDLVFELRGERLPLEHAAQLWDALVACLPWLADEPGAGVHPIRAAAGDGGLLLTRRARLVLRLPLRREADALRLCGESLDVAGERLAVGAARARPLEASPTLSARFVASGAADALAHQQAVEAMLDALALPKRYVCGTMRTLGSGNAAVSGAEVVLHQLRPEQSLALQERGLGGGRHLGHGLFVPHKNIVDID